MDTLKVEYIMQWPAPTNVLEVCIFMGLAGYYRWFIEGFSKIENPIREFQNKKKIINVCMDREMHGSISEAQGFVDINTYTKGP